MTHYFCIVEPLEWKVGAHFPAMTSCTDTYWQCHPQQQATVHRCVEDVASFRQYYEDVFGLRLDIHWSLNKIIINNATAPDLFLDIPSNVSHFYNTHTQTFLMTN